MCVCIFVSVRVVGCLKGRVFICLLLCACVCVWWETKLWETEKDRKGKCVTREGTMFSLAGILTSIKLPVSVRHGGVLTGKSRVVMLMFSWQTGTVLKRHGHTATLQHKQKHIFNTAPNLNQLLCLSFWLSLSFFLPLSPLVSLYSPLILLPFSHLSFPLVHFIILHSLSSASSLIGIPSPLLLSSL